MKQRSQSQVFGEEDAIPAQSLKIDEYWDDPGAYGGYAKKAKLVLGDVVELLGDQSPVTLQQIQDAEAQATLCPAEDSPSIIHDYWRVSKDGFSLHIPANDEAERQHLLGLLKSPDPNKSSADLNALVEAQSDRQLILPCTPAALAVWAERNEFFLPPSFLSAVGGGGHTTTPVSRADIVFYFKVKPDEAANQKWWDERMRDAKRYGLEQARASRGRGKKSQPMFYPDLIAAWLVDKKHMDGPAAAAVLRKHFSECEHAADLLDPPNE